MKFKFFFDKDIENTHIFKHNISVEEINEFFTKVYTIKKKRKDGSYSAIGKLKSGRYLEIAYRKISSDCYFIITAYDIENNELIEILEDYLERL